MYENSESDLKIWKVAILTKKVNDDFDKRLNILKNKPHMTIDIEKEFEGLLLDAEDNISNKIDENPTKNLQ
ncbi:hypothetical protein C1645_827723 [Glomus cerebriforme]|uniref:Uncharacterized protein n=1 Tax=Glomus cerebriforme TaxID=658196 RepID=A0A397SMW0_9GLOM|nr:hypothetical protein C1645_827723 [Glomus cerebriforme]